MQSESNYLSAPGVTHSVLFYSDDWFLIQSTVSFLLCGLARGDCIIILAMKKHVKKIELQLKATADELGIKYEKDQISTLEADQVLPTFMDNDDINADKFSAQFEPIIQETLAHYPGLTGYGDMVNILCEKNNFSAAIKLEQLWCGLAEKYQRLNLHCGYSIKNFHNKNDSIELAGICQQHTDVETQLDLIIPQETTPNNPLCFDKQKELDMELKSKMHELHTYFHEANILQKEVSSLHGDNFQVNERLESTIKRLQVSNLETFNLLNSVNFPIVYLDDQLQIYRYNAQFTGIVHLIPQDVGRSILDLNLQLDSDDLAARLKEVMADLKPQVIRAKHHNKMNYLICILPVTKSSPSPNGVVIFFINANFST